MMTLYVYDHCPYCVKARMIFGYKNINLELKFLLNDDEETPIRMIGQKMTPILEKEDGSYMSESLDIIDYVDQNFGEQPFINSNHSENLDLKTWLTESREYVYLLAMPRWIKADLEEFKTQEAVDYFTKRKESYIGSFSKHLKNTKFLIKKANKHLKALENLLSLNQSHFLNEPSINDIHLYPTLRSLSVVKKVQYPEKVFNYMKKQERLTQVPLHFDIAPPL